MEEDVVEAETTRTVDGIVPITRRTDAAEVATRAYARLLELLDQLDEDAWRAPTECTGWDVAAMVGHVIGAGRSGASIRESVRQQLWGRRHAAGFDGNSLDAVNDLQVQDHAALSPEQRIEALRVVAPAAVRGRMRLPAPLRRVAVPIDPGGSTAHGMPARLTLGNLMDVIYTRDVWLHTVDIARATSTPLDLDAGLDGRIVEDVVGEWARRHGEPIRLTLTGPAGGRFHQGAAGTTMELDAVAFCRILSGRAEPDETEAPGLGPQAVGLLRTRVIF